MGPLGRGNSCHSGNYARFWQLAVGPLGKIAKKQFANTKIKKLIAFAVRRGNLCHLGKGILLKIPPTQRYRFLFPWKRLCPLTRSYLEKSVFFFPRAAFFFPRRFLFFFLEKCISWSKCQNPLGKKTTFFTHSVDFERK